MSDDTFDAKRHVHPDHRGFENLYVGEEFIIPARTVTEAHFSAFQTLSCDNHPIHYDVEYCKEHGHNDMLAHGFQVLAHTAAGAGLFPHVVGEALIGFIEQSSTFLKGVYPGDTLYPKLTVTELNTQNTTGVVVMRSTVHNQHAELVLDGQHKYLLRLARAN